MFRLNYTIRWDGIKSLTDRQTVYNLKDDTTKIKKPIQITICSHSNPWFIFQKCSDEIWMRKSISLKKNLQPKFEKHEIQLQKKNSSFRRADTHVWTSEPNDTVSNVL
jgi:hypothetical protein